jgi:hypothetical protein
MNTLYSLLIEISLLAFLGGLYYMYQRKKILSHAQEQRDYLRGQISLLLYEELKESENLDYRKYLEILKNPNTTYLTFAKFDSLPEEIQELITEFNSL